MAKNNLAGLAALGALGMMMSKGSKGKGEDRDTVPGTNIPIASGESEAETFPNEYRYKVEKDFGGSSNIGEGYGPAPSSMMRREPTASRARATTPSSRSTISADDEAGISRGTRPRDPRNAEAGMSRGTRTTSMAGAGRGVTMPTQPQADSTTAEGMRNYVSRARTGTERDTSEIDRVRNLAGAFNVPMRQRLSEDGVPYKKGGAVKKMASGGMVSSASKRADGIAQKGKTRGKMC